MDGRKLIHEINFILLFVDDVLFSYNLESGLYATFIGVLDTFSQISGLIVNMVKTKTTPIKAIQPRNHPNSTYKRELYRSGAKLRIYTCINAPSTNKWNVCYEYKLQER